MEGLVELIDLVEEYEGKFNWVDELPDIMCGLLLDEDAPEQLYATLQGIATPPDGSLSPVSAFIDEILKSFGSSADMDPGTEHAMDERLQSALESNDDGTLIRQHVSSFGQHGWQPPREGESLIDAIRQNVEERADATGDPSEIAIKLGVVPEICWVEEVLHILIEGVHVEQELGAAMVDYGNNNWVGFGYNPAKLINQDTRLNVLQCLLLCRGSIGLLARGRRGTTGGPGLNHAA